MKKRAFLLIVVVLAGVFLFTACTASETSTEILDTFVDEAGVHYSLVRTIGADGGVSETVHVTEYSGPESSLSDLIEVNIPNEIMIGGAMHAVTVIDDTAFSGKNVWKVDVAEGIEKIGNFAFGYCNAQVISLPSTIKTIGEYAFVSCNNLSSLVLPATVPPELGVYAFKNWVEKDGVYRVNMILNISVPRSVENAYKTAWAEYADIINR